MHKQLLIILLTVFIGVNHGLTQIYSFQLFRVNPCTNITALDTSVYYLVNPAGYAYKSDNGTVWLDAKGTYNILFPRQRRSSFATITITDSANTHLHYDKKINIKYNIEQRSEAYYGCKGFLNGVHEDVYENGIVQMRGNFKNGIPRDSLTFFYPNGSIYQSVIFLRKKIYIREYDSLSVLSKVTHVLDQTYFFAEYNATSYYTNGRVKKIEKVRRKTTRTKEYYPNKQIKSEININTKVEYDTDGRVTARYSWKDVTGGNRLPIYTTYDVLKTSYNKLNQKTESIKYRIIHLGNTLPDFHVGNSDYFFYWKQYSDDGKETMLFTNISKQDIIKSGRWMYK